MKPKVALIATGGTIASVTDSPLHCSTTCRSAGWTGWALLARFPEVESRCRHNAGSVRVVSGYRIYYPEWRSLCGLCSELVAREPDLAGLVITHGTSSLEETAYFLNLTSRSTGP